MSKIQDLKIDFEDCTDWYARPRNLSLWGISGVVIGIVLLGWGVVPIGLLATVFKGLWELFFTLLGLGTVTVAARLIASFVLQLSELD